MTITVAPMRIVCPSCAAEYEVPDSALAAGRRLMRCARCHHRFEAGGSPDSAPAGPAPAEPELATAEFGAEPGAEPAGPPARTSRGAAVLRPNRPRPPAPELPPEEPPRERLVAAPPEPPRGRLAFAWLASLGVLGVAGWALWAYRLAIVEAWPPALRLYETLGLWP